MDFMAATGTSSAPAVVEACEVFASSGQHQWLKVAGEAKAQAGLRGFGASTGDSTGRTDALRAFDCSRFRFARPGGDRCISGFATCAREGRRGRVRILCWLLLRANGLACRTVLPETKAKADMLVTRYSYMDA